MTENIKINQASKTPVEMTAAEMLRNARTTGRRKREIPTIAKHLCIREDFLEALENGDYNKIPEVVYILGFARNYAMELGINPDEVVAKIKKEMGLVTDCVADDDEGGAACAMPSIKQEEHWFKIWFVRVYQFIYQRWQWFVGALAVVVLAIILVAVFSPSDDEKSVAAESPVVTETVAEPKYNLSVRERFGVDNRESADVVLQATQESWVKIEDGRGNTVFSRVLVPGDVYYVPAGDKYKATFGNAGGIDIWVDGVLAPEVGADHARKSGISMSPKSLMEKK